jgi:acetyl esterase/lipase
VDDCRAALVFIRDHAKEWGVDPSKIVVMGDSAGGHLAALAGMIPAPAGNPGVAAMILCNPIVDLTEGDWMKFVIGGRALEKNPPPDAKIPTAQQTALARELSPLCLARPGLPPTLLMHGSEDHVVNPHQVRAFAAAMSSCGNSCELDMIAGARHAFILPKYTAPEPLVVESLKKADAFLASLGFVSGPPTLEVSSTPAWQPLK